MKFLLVRFVAAVVVLAAIIGVAPARGQPPVTNGLQLWFDASEITGKTDGDPIAQWDDMSGGGHNTTGVRGTGNPTYAASVVQLNSMPAVRFNLDSGFTLGNLSALFPSAANLFVVVRLDNDNGGGGYNWSIFSTANNDDGRWAANDRCNNATFRTPRTQWDGAPQFRWEKTPGDTGVPRGPVRGVLPYLFTLESNNSGWKMWQDGDLLSGGTTPAGYSAGNEYFISGGAPADYFTGWIAEIVVYSSTLSAAEKNAVGYYLEAKYNLSTAYTLPAPAMDVTGFGNSITNGDITPSGVDGTDFGMALTNTAVTNIFTIRNSGDQALSLTGTPLVYVDGDFSVTATPSTPVALGGGTTTFSVVFLPSGSPGVRSTTLSITNNSSKNPYQFTLKGIATAVPAPRIEVSGLGNKIANGDITPNVSDDTDYGFLSGGSSASHLFTIANVGTTNLNLNGATRVEISGDVSCFVAPLGGQQGPPILAPSETNTFTVQFNASGAAGLKVATVSIASDDADNDPYTFTLSGTVYYPPVPRVRDGLQLWFDASQILGKADGDPIAQWDDMSGGGHHTTGVRGGGAPTYAASVTELNNKPALRFNGNNGFTLGNLSALFPGEASLFVVVKLDNVNGDGGLAWSIFSTANNDDGRWAVNDRCNNATFRTPRTQWDGPPQFRWEKTPGDTGVPRGPVRGVLPYLFTLESNNSGWKMWQDGDLLSGGTTPAGYSAGNEYFISGGAPADYFTGWIAEILVYNRTLTPEEMNNAGYQLAEKYGLTTSYTAPVGVRGTLLLIR